MKKRALLYSTKEGKRVHCFLCSHQCKIDEGRFGMCKVRQNIEGTLYTHVYGRIITQHIDPIEKKPLYHFLPGTKTYSIATPGCNFRCGFCQNWQISQYKLQNLQYEGRDMSPEDIVAAAKQYSCYSIAYTYTEPTIFFEYAFDTAKLAKKESIRNVFVTNGYMTLKAIDLIAPYLDAANVDLKSFRDDFYKKVCGARLEPVLDSIKAMHEKKIWIEITTLVIPGQNDSEQELNDIAEFIASVSTAIPWHVSRFHPDHQFMDVSSTPIETLQMAERIGRNHGLKDIHLGNV